MQYKTNKKIIIDKRKLDTVIRLGCPDDVLLFLITKGEFKPTGDSLIDENLESMIEEKEFTNWGGNHNPTGKNQYTKKNNNLGQNKGQLDHQVEGQDIGQDVDKDKDKDKDINNNNKKNKRIISTVVSDDWKPNDRTRQKLEEMNLDVDKVVAKFINSCQASNRKYVDFNKAILSWNWENDKNLQRKIEEWTI